MVSSIEPMGCDTGIDGRVRTFTLAAVFVGLVRHKRRAGIGDSSFGHHAAALRRRVPDDGGPVPLEAARRRSTV